MPLYDFECENCGRVEEVLMVPGELWDQQNCDCRWGAKMRRLPAAPAFVLKGYGFTPKFHTRGRKDPNDTLEETENGQLRDKTGAGHDAP